MPKVSVIIPAYNCQSYVGRAVQSVLDQDHRNLEIIVVDDGSTDNTVQALLPYQHQVRLLRQENAGAGAARNTGLRAAQGELLAFLDADDWWEQTRISAQLAALAAFPGSGIVFSDFAVVDSAAGPLMSRGIRWKYGSIQDAQVTSWNRIFSSSKPIRWPGMQPSETQVMAYHGHILPWLFRGNFINTCTVLMKREVFEKTGEFDQTLQTEEDYEYWLRVARAWPFTYVDVPLVSFRRSSQQLTHADKIERVVRNVLTVIQRTSASMSSQLDPKEITSRFAQLHLRLGAIALRAGRNADARRFLAKCLNHRAIRLTALMLYLLTFFPSRVFTTILQLHSRLK